LFFLKTPTATRRESLREKKTYQENLFLILNHERYKRILSCGNSHEPKESKGRRVILFFFFLFCSKLRDTREDFSATFKRRGAAVLGYETVSLFAVFCAAKRRSVAGFTENCRIYELLQ
jgi:hypothetical protein